MFRALLCLLSGARDYNVDYHIGRFVLVWSSVWSSVRITLTQSRFRDSKL